MGEKIVNSFEIRICIQSGKKTELKVDGYTGRSEDKYIVVNDRKFNICELTYDIIKHVEIYMNLKKEGTI